MVSGFVGSIAGALKIDKRELVARLRRDYPPKKLRINPKPDVSDKFVWGPRLTFITGVGVVLLLVLSYLFFQYIRFISPPPLKVEKPQEGQVVAEPILEVLGSTDPEAVIRVNNQPVLVVESPSKTKGEGEISLWFLGLALKNSIYFFLISSAFILPELYRH